MVAYSKLFKSQESQSLLKAAFLASAVLLSQAAHAVIFSVDPASPLIDGSITPDDILSQSSNGLVVVKQGSSMGLQDDFYGGVYDNLDAVSTGNDHIDTNKPIYFSVDRVSVGVSGSDIYNQALPSVEDAARGIFQALPPVGSNTLFTKLGTTAGFFGDDVDAFDFANNVSSPLYFSIDSLSASNGFGSGCNAANIYKDNISTVWHGYTSMGLYCGDDIDALAINLQRNIALFSLSSFSASTFTFTGLDYQAGIKDHLSPADILFTDFNGRFSLWKPAATIGLLLTDNLDALALIPEPGTVSLLVAGLLGGWFKGRCKARNRADM